MLSVVYAECQILALYNDTQHYNKNSNIQYIGSVAMFSGIMQIVAYNPFMLSVIRLTVVYAEC
jgi:hypothetical protein